MSFVLPPEKEPALYILMRSDLDSLNPGKMVAQGAHAANQFVAMLSQDHFLYPLYEQWRSSTPHGFGVTLCLDVSGEELPLVVEAARRAGFAAGVTHDPSYPLRDGGVTHTFPLDTCGYVFGNKPDLHILLGQFDLLK
jgi:peptidyl-tRNA hydrolase